MCLVTKMQQFHGPSQIFSEGLTMPLGAYCEFMTSKATERWRRMVIRNEIGYRVLGTKTFSLVKGNGTLRIDLGQRC